MRERAAGTLPRRDRPRDRRPAAVGLATCALRQLERDDLEVVLHRVVEPDPPRALLHARAEADLALFKDPIVTVRFQTFDVKVKAGKTLSVNLGAPWNLTGDFKIQQVSISEPYPGELPLRRVEASSVRFSFEDMIRRVQLSA